MEPQSGLYAVKILGEKVTEVGLKCEFERRLSRFSLVPGAAGERFITGFDAEVPTSLSNTARSIAKQPIRFLEFIE